MPSWRHRAAGRGPPRSRRRKTHPPAFDVEDVEGIVKGLQAYKKSPDVICNALAALEGMPQAA